MEVPLLTIITPVLNGQRFIESCLQSVIDQNCRDVEHLIIDGGSTDMTLRIIERYAKRHAHIRWISEKDNGQSSAMNKGVSLARGRIVGFLNCDDYYEPAVFIRILNIFKILPHPSFLVGNCNVLNDDEKIVYLNKPSRLSLNNILIGGEKNQFPFNPSAYFYHKSLHERTGPYDESNHTTMDLDFIIRVIRCAHVRYVDETWGNFRFIRGTKTFQSKENNQIEANKLQVINVYLKKLPWFQRFWIWIIQFIFVRRQVHYFAGRIKNCFRDPKEIQIFILKKLNLSFFRSPLHRQNQEITQSVENEAEIDNLQLNSGALTADKN
jgi:glycosyltransferase involved in cell wall biosynthesis